MFKIIGIDGRQYGPVDAEQIKRWIAAGRADASTKAQAEGSQDWKALAEFPEFAEALAAKGGTSQPDTKPPLPDGERENSANGAGGQSGSPPHPGPLPQGGEGVAAVVQVASPRAVVVDVGSCLGRAWDKMMADLWTIVGISALVWIALSASHAVYVGIVITGPLLGGLYYYYLKKIRGQTAELQDAFAGFTLAFVQLLLASLVSGALIALGLALCVIPGIYLAVAWCFALPLVIDKNMSFWDAMELSRKTVYHNWWSVFWLMVVCGLINFGGGLLCCVGIFFTLPLTGLAVMYAYNDVFGAIPAKSA